MLIQPARPPRLDRGSIEHAEEASEKGELVLKRDPIDALVLKDQALGLMYLQVLDTRGALSPRGAASLAAKQAKIVGTSGKSVVDAMSHEPFLCTRISAPVSDVLWASSRTPSRRMTRCAVVRSKRTSA